MDDGNTAGGLGLFTALNEKQFEYCRFKSNPPLSVQYTRSERQAREAIFTEMDEDAVEEDEDDEEPYHEALRDYQIRFTYQVGGDSGEDSADA